MNSFRRYFLSGLVIFLPLALTIYLLVLTFNLADGFLGKYIEPYFAREFGFYVRGLSILICILLVLFIGFLATHFFGKKLYPAFEGFLLRLPFFKQVYPALKEVALFLFSHEKKFKFQQVVFIEYPRKGIYSIGFLTNEVPKKVRESMADDMCYVFVPHTPSPLSGFLTITPRKELIFPPLTVEEAVKIIVSAGVVKSEA